MQQLTPVQQRALDAIRHYIQQEGFSPSLREIGKVLGHRSTNATKEVLDRLAAKRAIARTRGVPRSIRLLEVP